MTSLYINHLQVSLWVEGVYAVMKSLDIPDENLPTEQKAPRTLSAGHWKTEHNMALLMKMNIIWRLIKIDSVLAKEIQVT